MILGDGETSSRHPITINLDSCLHMRYEHDIRILWIDAICIDQTNNEEKKTQIILMRDIYRHAQRVCVFLGESSPETELPLTIIVAIVDAEGLANSYTGDRRLVPSDLRHLKALTTSPWWERIWVVQEAWLNVRVDIHAGNTSISMKTLRRFAEVWRSVMQSMTKETRAFALQDDEGITPPEFTLMYGPIIELLNVGTQYLVSQMRGVYGDEDDSFLKILAQCRSQKATNAQDKVYALLGLCSQTFLDSFPPTLDLQTAQVYTNFAVAYLLHTNNLSLFNQCALEPATKLKLPSWLSDWSMNSRSLDCNADRLDTQHFYQAGSQHPLMFKLLEERTLCLKGVFVDTISDIGDINTLHNENGRPSSNSNSASTFNQWETMTGVTTFKGKGARYVAGGAFIEAYWKTLFGDIMLPQQNLLAGARRCKGSDLLQYSMWISKVKAKPPIHEPSGAQASVLNATANRRFIICNKGYIGMAHDSVKKGDHIYVLPGGRVPCVLRPLANAERKGTFQLIGECYIHGIMDGEALESSPPGDRGLMDPIRLKMYKGNVSDRDLGREMLREIFLK